MSCGVGRRLGWDPALLRLWRRPVAVAPIGPVTWESPYAASAAIEKTKKKKKKPGGGELASHSTAEVGCSK